ncbi:MAG: HAMP domain-containing histidine kinase [Proteobacteria bacterium]|nr:HAMP domain-containing histidine kinase [Pseudomonadota bacterium]
MPNSTAHRPRTPHSPRALAATLAWLRVCAVIGQLTTVLFVAQFLRLQIDEGALFAGIAALALFDVFVWWRLRQPWPLGETEVVMHLAVDSGVLCYLLYLTGGAANPFVTLYIIPIALAAMTLSPRHLAASVLIASLAYLIVLFYHAPLPDIAHRALAGANVDLFHRVDLHALGMTMNFVISAVLLGFFIWRLARDLSERETTVRRERERALRDEGILAIATQAAGTAHELNTPLSTIRTLVGELRREHPADSPLGEDLALLSGQAERCRNILRELVQIGSAQLNEQAQEQTLTEFVEDCGERFRLLRPAIDLEIRIITPVQMPPLRIVPALRHALLNVLNNAADASVQGGREKVELSASGTTADIFIEVRDYGLGLPSSVREAAGMRFVSAKRDGLGLGLVLTNATVERFQGTLRAIPAIGGGTTTCLSVPVASLTAAKLPRARASSSD